MKRFLQSIGIVLLGSILLGLIAWVLADILDLQFPEWVAAIFGYLFVWPMLLLRPFMPASDSPDPNAPFIRIVLYLSGLLLDILVYSLLIYVILRWRSRRNRLP